MQKIIQVLFPTTQPVRIFYEIDSNEELVRFEKKFCTSNKALF